MAIAYVEIRRGNIRFNGQKHSFYTNLFGPGSQRFLESLRQRGININLGEAQSPVSIALVSDQASDQVSLLLSTAADIRGVGFCQNNRNCFRGSSGYTESNRLYEQSGRVFFQSAPLSIGSSTEITLSVNNRFGQTVSTRTVQVVRR